MFIDKLKKLICLSKSNKLHHALLITSNNKKVADDFLKKFVHVDLCNNLDIKGIKNSQKNTKGNLQENTEGNLQKNSQNNTQRNLQENSQLIKPCGNCHSCNLYIAGNHLDLKFIDLEAKSSFITVDQIRELKDFMKIKEIISSKKIAVVFSADRLNIQASNALLKILEEPEENKLLILIAKSKNQLLPTISSRCMEVHLKIDGESASKITTNFNFDGTIKNVNKNINEQQNNLKTIVSKASSKESKKIDGLADNENFNILIKELYNLFAKKNINIVAVIEKWKKFYGTKIMQVFDDLYIVLSNIIFKKYDINNMTKAERSLFSYNSCNNDSNNRNDNNDNSDNNDSNDNFNNYLNSLKDLIFEKKIFLSFDNILKAKRNINSGHNLNVQLILENLLITLKY